MTYLIIRELRFDATTENSGIPARAYAMQKRRARRVTGQMLP